MFRIGEFSRIARVSGRLLRYYDGIGLLSPRRIDPGTGYRYYTADQLGQLNRILALKDLGLSLDQVARMVREEVSPDEIRGMLMLKKAELERTLSEETVRLRHIESRLLQIDEQGGLKDYDVIVKSVVAQPYLSLRRTFADMAAVVAAVGDVVRAVHPRVPGNIRGDLTVIAYSDFDDENLDIEIGIALKAEPVRAIRVPGIDLMLGELPAVDTLATLVRSGPADQSHIAFGALGLWMEANHYRIDGPSREVLLELPLQESAVMEIQFPVAQAA